MRLFILLITFFLLSAAPLVAHETESIKVVVVGDTGIGERAFHTGFDAVQNAMRREKADAILHLGDFVYQPEKFPKSCPGKYIQEIKNTLVDPSRRRPAPRHTAGASARAGGGCPKWFGH